MSTHHSIVLFFSFCKHFFYMKKLENADHKASQLHEMNNTWINPTISARLFIVSRQRRWYRINRPNTEALFADENRGVALNEISEQWWCVYGESAGTNSGHVFAVELDECIMQPISRLYGFLKAPSHTARLLFSIFTRDAAGALNTHTRPLARHAIFQSVTARSRRTRGKVSFLSGSRRGARSSQREDERKRAVWFELMEINRQHRLLPAHPWWSHLRREVRGHGF